MFPEIFLFGKKNKSAYIFYKCKLQNRYHLQRDAYVPWGLRFVNLVANGEEFAKDVNDLLKTKASSPDNHCFGKFWDLLALPPPPFLNFWLRLA